MSSLIACFKLIRWIDILATGSSIVSVLITVPISLAATTEYSSSSSIRKYLGSPTIESSLSPPWLIAGANHFNPDLKLPAPSAPVTKPTPPPIPTPVPSGTPSDGTAQSTNNPSANSATSANSKPFAVLEELKPNINSTWNNSGQVNRTIEQTAIFLLNNGDKLNFTTGYNSYEQPGSPSANNIPLQVEWETKDGLLKIQPGIGLNFLNGSINPNFSLKANYPVAKGLTVSADISQGPYTFNAQTIGNQISALRYGPSIYWAIDSNTTLFSSLKLGNYSDGNAEVQSFSRIEHKLGDFSVAGNLFTWGYKNPTDRGYFAPSDFIVYTAEVAWEGTLTNFLKCRVVIPFGGQSTNGLSSDAGGYQTKCTAKLSSNIEADLGYSFSNVRNQLTGLSTANTQSISTQFRIKF